MLGSMISAGLVIGTASVAILTLSSATIALIAGVNSGGLDQGLVALHVHDNGGIAVHGDHFGDAFGA